jgi:hypothetical protein
MFVCLIPMMGTVNEINCESVDVLLDSLMTNRDRTGKESPVVHLRFSVLKGQSSDLLTVHFINCKHLNMDVFRKMLFE